MCCSVVVVTGAANQEWQHQLVEVIWGRRAVIYIANSSFAVWPKFRLGILAKVCTLLFMLVALGVMARRLFECAIIWDNRSQPFL